MTDTMWNVTLAFILLWVALLGLLISIDTQVRRTRKTLNSTAQLLNTLAQLVLTRFQVEDTRRELDHVQALRAELSSRNTEDEDATP